MCGNRGAGQTFSYDQYGNISKSGTSSWIPGYDPKTNHALGVTYDANGNMTNDTFHKYAWYVDSKLGSTDSTTCNIFGSTDGTCILYDAFGREVERGVNGAYTEVMYTPVGKTAIMNGLTSTVSAYFPLPGGATYDQTGTANGSGYFWHKDWLGSVRLASSVLNRTYYFDRAFAPYGEMYDNFGNTAGLNFAGDTQDSFTGLLFDTPNRELHPVQGRWISPDPAGAGSNLYAYVNNNPMIAIDPLGLLENDVQGFFLTELDASNRNVDFSFNSFVDWNNHQTFGNQYYNLPGHNNEIAAGQLTYLQSIYGAHNAAAGSNGFMLSFYVNFWAKCKNASSDCLSRDEINLVQFLDPTVPKDVAFDTSLDNTVAAFGRSGITPSSIDNLFSPFHPAGSFHLRDGLPYCSLHVVLKADGPSSTSANMHIDSVNPQYGLSQIVIHGLVDWIPDKLAGSGGNNLCQ